MRILSGLVFVCWLAAGCGPSTPHEDPTVNAFTGKLLRKGQPVSFSADDKVVLQLIYKKKAENFGIPIKPDGTFQIGWMPIGEYAAILQHTKLAAKGGQANYSVPSGLTIESGKTEYAIELGDKYKP